MTESSSPIPVAPLPAPAAASIFGPVHLTRAMIFGTAIIFAIIFRYAAGLVHWPQESGFRASLSQPPVALGAFITAIALLVVLTVVGTLLIGRRWFLSGLMAATAGLATWSVRGGTMTQVLFNAQNAGSHQSIFLLMFGELIVFYAVIGGLWTLIWNMISTTSGVDTTGSDGAHSRDARVTKAVMIAAMGAAGYVVWARARRANQTGTIRASEEARSTGAALLAQTAIMLILMILLVVTPMKKQVLTSVFLSGVISTAIAEYFFADRKSARWYWIAPLVVGAIGYLAGYFAPTGLETGDLQGILAPLSRVLPLDYASMGCAGVLFGYWWMEPDPAATEPKPAAT